MRSRHGLGDAVSMWNVWFKMWRHLDAEHNRKDVASKFAVMTQLLGYRYKGKGIQAHCDDVIALLYNLASKGMTFDSDFMVCLLLHSLPAEYSTFVTTINAQVGVTLTIDLVRTRAIAEEMRLRRTGADHVLFSSKDNRIKMSKPESVKVLLWRSVNASSARSLVI